MKKRIVVGALASLLMVGCASDPLVIQQEAVERKTEALQDHLDEVPDWAIKPPKPTAYGMYGVGIARSTDLAVAIKKARLLAEFDLATQYKQEISGSERMYTADTGGNAASRYVALVDKLVARLSLSGMNVEESVIKPVDGKYEAYILMMLPYDAANVALQQLKEAEMSQTMKEAFDDLERRLDKHDERVKQRPVAEITL